MNTSLITHVLPGHTAPRAYLNMAVQKYPTVFGFAVRHEGKIEFEQANKMWPVEQIEELLEGTKSEHRILFMGNWPKFADGDIQPFSLKDSDDNVLLAIFMEGDASTFAGVNGDHTEEYNASDEMVFPRISKAYDDATDDDAFYEALRADGSPLRKTLLKVFDHRGVYCLLPKTGDPIAFGDNDIGGSYAWGHSSQAKAMGYAEAAPVEPAKPGKVLSFMEKLRGSASSPPPAPAADPPPVETPKPDTKIDAPPAPDQLVPVSPPAGLNGKAKNFWLRLFNDRVRNGLPDNHENKDVKVWTHPKLVELSKIDVRNKRDVENLENRVKKIRDENPLEPPKDLPLPKPEAKPTETPPPAEAGTKLSSARSGVRESATDYLPVLSTVDKEKAMGLMADILDSRSEKQLTPVQIQKLESRWPVFSSEIGIEFNELLFVPIDQLVKLFDGNKIAACAFIEMRRRYIEGSGIKLEDLVRGSTKPDEGAVNTETANDKTAKAAATSSAPPAKKGGGLSWLKSA